MFLNSIWFVVRAKSVLVLKSRTFAGDRARITESVLVLGAIRESRKISELQRLKDPSPFGSSSLHLSLSLSVRPSPVEEEKV